ncbi:MULTISPECIES: polysaccharide pyruvyl transferase family protein [unclassified Microbacterium]|uniref:polysaccharide pyruvyl transferase family protein n=1 Tax=unclassified Microbacterium TaxID=2609290 RepID=UPI00109D2165|nr:MULTISPECIES: polysaccharide pyruvyl transferase family protein [unclassified Microbacterium]
MIGFTGPYSDVNFGDYAMLVNNIYALDAQEACVFVYDEGFMRRICQDYFHERGVRLVEVSMRPGAFSSDREIRHLTPIEIIDQIQNLDEVIAAVSTMSTLYVNGGGYLNSLWTQPHRFERLVQIIAPALVAATLGVPVKFTANGYGPFRGDTEFFAAFFGSLPGAEFGMRDKILSPYWLNAAGVPRDQIRALPDDLLFIEDELAPVVEREGDRYVLMETYLPTTFLEENFSHFEAFTRNLADRYGLRVIFVPFNLGHGGVDQGEYLASRLAGVETFDISGRGYLPIEEAVSLVRNAELVISSRYHAVILALSVGTPFVSVLKDVLGDKQYYYGKNVGALQGVLEGQPHDVRDYFFMEYVDALTAVVDDFDGITRRQREAYSAAFPRTSVTLRAAREEYLLEKTK